MYVKNPFNGKTTEELNLYLQQELTKLEGVFREFIVDHYGMAKHNQEPNRPQEGDVYFADGINWNPGFGNGPYVWLGSEWSPLFRVTGIWNPSLTPPLKRLRLIGYPPSYNNTTQKVSPVLKTLDLSTYSPKVVTTFIKKIPTGGAISLASNNPKYITVTKKSYSSETSSSETLYVSPDGTHLYILTFNRIYQYSMSAFDLSTLTYDSKSLAVSSSPRSFFLKDDGTKLYLTKQFAPKAIEQYTLSTAWDISTASTDSKTFDYSNEVGESSDIYMTASKLYITDRQFPEDAIYEYDITSWEIDTAVYTNNKLDLSDTLNIEGIAFNDDGSVLYVMSYLTQRIFKYNLSTPYDLSSADEGSVYSSISFGTTTAPFGLFVFEDEGKIYFLDNFSDRVNQIYISE